MVESNKEFHLLWLSLPPLRLELQPITNFMLVELIRETELKATDEIVIFLKQAGLVVLSMREVDSSMFY